MAEHCDTRVARGAPNREKIVEEMAYVEDPGLRGYQILH